jgi:predicted 2-oxoglutarate/Fe(II)-dependent dioxygenase YbiX
LTEAECAEWVRVAEKAGAARGGWTTSRHYAVPTTDIPVHAIPHLLPLWNDLMRDKLAPLLASMCPSEMPTPSSVRVHDAFVVRYESGAQHHLPMHMDQSAMSVTLALNDAGEYDGGGTMFAAPVGETVRPGRGHVVAFKGGLQHGGSPVTRGTRYIVAAFLFAE